LPLCQEKEKISDKRGVYFPRGGGGKWKNWLGSCSWGERRKKISRAVSLNANRMGRSNFQEEKGAADVNSRAGPRVKREGELYGGVWIRHRPAGDT